MPGISVITNFDVNANAPIDSRMVVSNSTTRNQIQYVYEGLKVYQLSDKRTYLWNGTTWSIDTGLNGIYGGSGSLVGSTNVNFGTIGNTAGNTGVFFQYDTTTLQHSNSVNLSSYFRRHTTVGSVPSNQWSTVEYIEQFRVFNGSSVLNGPYISFNPDGTQNGSIAFGIPKSLNMGGLREFVRIGWNGVGINNNLPIGYLHIGNNSTYEHQLVLHVTSTQSIIGSNWNPTSGIILSTEGSSRIVMDNNGVVNIFNRSSGNLSPYTQSVSIAPNNIRILNDISANAWDGNSPINYQLRTIPDYVNNSEHRWTKIQSENWQQLSVSAYDDVNKWLLIPDSANNFEIFVTASTDRYISDIKISRNGVPSELPDGTRLNIRFKHSNVPSNGNEFYIKLGLTPSDVSSNIFSAYNDSIIGGTVSRIKISHSPSTAVTNLNRIGDNITFLKGSNPSGPKWEVVNVERQSSLVDPRIGGLTTADFFTASTTAYSIDQLSVKYKKIGTTYFCQLYMEFTVTSSTLSNLGTFSPRPTNELYGKSPISRSLQVSYGHGPGIGNFPYPFSMDVSSVGAGANGFLLNMRKLDFGRTQSGGGLNPGYGFFATGSNNIYATFMVHG